QGPGGLAPIPRPRHLGIRVLPPAVGSRAERRAPRRTKDPALSLARRPAGAEEDGPARPDAGGALHGGELSPGDPSGLREGWRNSMEPARFASHRWYGDPRSFRPRSGPGRPWPQRAADDADLRREEPGRGPPGDAGDRVTSG